MCGLSMGFHWALAWGLGDTFALSPVDPTPTAWLDSWPNLERKVQEPAVKISLPSERANLTKEQRDPPSTPLRLMQYIKTGTDVCGASVGSRHRIRHPEVTTWTTWSLGSEVVSLDHGATSVKLPKLLKLSRHLFTNVSTVPDPCQELTAAAIPIPSN